MKSHRRNGKVARLPHATRQLINQLLDDGVMSKDIITQLGDIGRGLTVHNISNWRMGGYQDHLNQQRHAAAGRARAEAAAALAKTGGLPTPDELVQTLNQVSMLQQLELLAEKGGDLAAEAFRRIPAKMITLINACTKLSNANVTRERLQWRRATRQFKTGPPSKRLLLTPNPPPHKTQSNLIEPQKNIFMPSTSGQLGKQTVNFVLGAAGVTWSLPSFEFLSSLLIRPSSFTVQ